MRPNSRLLSLASLAVGAALVAAACSSAGSTPEATVLAATSAPTQAASAVNQTAAVTLGVTNSPTLGGYLTGDKGMTLYIFTKDTPDTSVCSGSCATSWPPLTVASGAMIQGPTGATGTFATIARADGTMQVTYNHWPLYYFAGDSAAGDTNGQGKLGVWFVAPLSGSLPSTAAPAATPAPTTATTTGY